MAKQAPVKHVKLTPEMIAQIEATVFSRIEPLLPEPYYLLAVNVEKEAAQWLLQIFIERPASDTDGISLQDCEQVSRQLEKHWESIDTTLQQKNPILKDWSYHLEISSPGLFRPLRTAREFAFYQGRAVRIEELPVEIKMKKSESFQKKALKQQPPTVLYSGTLQAYDEQTQTVSILDQASNTTVSITVDPGKQVLLNPPLRLEDEDAVLTIV